MFKVNKIIILLYLCFFTIECKSQEKNHFADCYLGIEDDEYTEIHDEYIQFISGNWFFWSPWKETASSITDLQVRFDLLNKTTKESWGELYTLYNDHCMFNVYYGSNPIDNAITIGKGYIKDENIVLDYDIRIGMTKEDFSYSVCLAEKYKSHLERVSLVIVESIVDGQHWEFHFSNNKLSEIRIETW